jgi:hypothetical protein
MIPENGQKVHFRIHEKGKKLEDKDSKGKS